MNEGMISEMFNIIGLHIHQNLRNLSIQYFYEYFLITGLYNTFNVKQGRKRPLDTPKRMIARRERERTVEGEIWRGRER